MLDLRATISRSRGFTLVELLAVVTITAVLALVGINTFKRYISSSKGTEAMSVIQAIRAAEESYIAENHVYKNVSNSPASTPDNVNGVNWYPNISPNTTNSEWHSLTHPDKDNWAALAPAVNRPVQFGYLVNAGVGGIALTVLKTANSPVFALPTADWYVIQAKGDTDGDGIYAMYASTSMTGEIYTENEGE